MRILFVLSRVPYPLEKGDKLRAFHMIKELSLEHEINLFCLADEKVHGSAESELKKYCSEIYIHRIPWTTRIWRMVLAVFRKEPFQVAYFHSPHAQLKFNAFIEKHLPQHIFCQLLRTVPFVTQYTLIPKTLDYMDAFSAGMKKMAGSSKWPFSLIMDAEYRRLESYEKEVSSIFNHHLIITEQDKKCISIPQEISVVPNGIDPNFFLDRSNSKTRDLLFTGNMSYKPNVESAKFLVNEVMPIVWKSLPEVKLTLAGANPAASIKELESERVEITGWVDDICSVYASAKIFVAPMLINSGLQNKLLEAMASGLPCITTSLANNALGATMNQEILIANTPLETAQHIIKLLTYPDLSNEIALKGKQYVVSTYDWKAEVKRMKKIMGLSQG